MRLFLLVSLVAAAWAIPPPKAAVLKVEKGVELPIESPDYPQVPPPGTKVIWHLNSDSDTSVLLVCDDLRISPSPDCEKGYFSVDDGEREQKYCGSEAGLTVKSRSNTMKLEFDLNWAQGLAKCMVKGVENYDSATKPDDGDKGTEINLVPGGAAYDNINIPRIPKDTKKKWSFVTKPGSKIAMHCTEILMSSCDQSRLIITDGGAKETVCEDKYSYTKMSSGNTLTVELVVDVGNQGRLNCLVQAVTGGRPFEYRNIVSQEVDSSEHGRNPGPRKTDCNCGWTAKNAGRIVNGQDVSDGQYPWVVSMNYNGGHICGGSIITEYHILTAAHCTVGKEAKNMKILVGTTNNRNADKGQKIQVKEIINHDYVSADFHRNDVAILLLEEKIKFTERIGPVCLTPDRVPIDHKFITVMGWGALGKEGDWENPVQMKRAHMRVVDYNTCSYLWYRKFETDQPSRVCTWASNRDSCFGDSGGPLVWLDPETNRYTQIALVSFGRGCNTDYPKVNSNVAHFYAWIQQIINKTKPEPSVQSCKKI